MPVSQSTIKTAISAMLDATDNLELAAAKDAFADQLATVVYNAILSAQVNIAIGAVVTTGSATTQSNPAPVLGTLS